MKRSLALSSALLIAGFATSALAVDLATLPDLTTLPQGYVQISPLIPLLGEHYGRGKLGAMPYDPVYCGYKGKVTCIEYLLLPSDLAAGKTWKSLSGLEGLPPVDHIDIDYEPSGHGDWSMSLYNLRIYFISVDDLKQMTM
jgi:hypothetical protein